MRFSYDDVNYVSPPYFVVVVELAWSSDPESYAGGSVGIGRVSIAGQVKGDDPDKKRHPGPPGWGWSMWLTTTPHEKNTCWVKSRIEKKTD